MEKLLKKTDWIKLLEGIDHDEAERAHQEGCRYCGSKLHCANYGRKVRGVEGWDKRYSYCCSQCRLRMTPVSVRFLGRRIYAGFIVVLVAALLQQGPTRRRVTILSREFGIAERTLKRWREWWLGEFVESPFWKGGRAMFMPLLNESEMPLSLADGFKAKTREGLVKLMKFLSPVTTGAGLGEQAM